MASDVSSKDAVVCRGVGKTWAAGTKRAHEALRDIDLDIQPGDAILLIVEDDPHYARVLIDLARDKGFKVLVANRGA